MPAGRTGRRARRRAVRDGRRLVRRPAPTTARGSATGRPTRSASRDGLGPLDRARYTASACGSACGSSRRWSNPDSDLYRAHPDWVLHFPHRDRTAACATSWCSTSPGPTSPSGCTAALDRLVRRERYRLPQVGHEPPVHRGRAGRSAARRATGLPGPTTSATSTRSSTGCAPTTRACASRRCAGGGGRVDLGILRAHRSGLDLGQHRRLGPGRDPGRLHPGLPGAAMMAWVTDSPEPVHRPGDPAALPLPRRDGRACSASAAT